jgi:outer membrane protein OmpA-like peptidoglycan-associated protein
MASSDSRRWDRRTNGPDSDGDGLSDADELRYHTDPYNPDTDGDGLRDSYEIYTFHTDPTKWDTDGDGLSDGDEVRIYHTDPLNKDTDGDGLSDGDEVKIYHTDPLKKDTDGDGLDDGTEVNVSKTNPLDPDTDHGGVKDGIEVAQHMNPLDPSDDYLYSSNQPSSTETKPPVERKLDMSMHYLLNGIVFNTGSTEISPVSVGILEKTYKVLKENPDLRVEIQGHTDNVGSAASNLDLSQRRAMAVRAWFIDKGIDGSRLTTKGFGFSRPVASNSSEAGRRQNRRIEFVIVR